MGKKGYQWYYELSCGHIRMLKTPKGSVIQPGTDAFCVKCDIFSTVVSKAERW